MIVCTLLFLVGEGLPTDPGVLTNAHLRQLLNLLKPIAPKWKDFGIQLGIDLDDLNAIERHPNLAVEGVGGYLRECLSLSVRQYRLTKSNILKALRSRCIGEEKVAKDFEETFKGTCR